MMKYKIIALALMMVGFACQAQNQVDKQGRKQGHWVKTDKKGIKIYEGDFKDGLETGTFEYFYPNGKLRIKNVFTIPGKYCSHEAFDQEGNRLAKGFYNQKNRDGVWEFFNEAGRRVKLTTYKMGVKEGIQVVFTSNNDTAEVCTWSDNHRNGRWWKRIGKKGYITGRYVKGGLEGKLVEYDDNNQLVREGHYKNGFKHGSYKFFEDGKLVIDETWNDGFLRDRRVRLLLPEERFVSIYDIAYMVPQGKNKVIVYLEDNTKLIDQEEADVLYDRVGNELFGMVNHKGRIMVATRMINGITHDSEGREILDLDPKPDFVIFPDEDCMRLVRSKKYQDEGKFPGED